MGWPLVAQRGSHKQYAHPAKPGKVTVAGKPGADVPKGTAANILRQAGLRRPAERLSEYLVVIEHEGESWGAYCPDLPGRGAVGDSRAEAEQLLRDPIAP